MSTQLVAAKHIKASVIQKNWRNKAKKDKILKEFIDMHNTIENMNSFEEVVMYLKNRDNIMKFKNGLETILHPISAKCTELQTVEWKNLNARVTMSNYMIHNFPHRVFKDPNHRLAKNIMDSSKLISKAIDATAQFILTRRPIPDDVSNALLVAVVEHDEHFKQWERDDKPKIVGNIKGALAALIESRKLYESEPQHTKFDKVHEMGNDNALIEEFNTQVARLRKKLHALADAADIAEMEELIMQSGFFPAYTEDTNNA